MLSTLTIVDDNALAQIKEEMHVRKTSEVFLLFTMGSQFDQLIKMHLDKLGVFCLVADPASVTAEDVRRVAPIGIVISGGPASVHDEPPPFDQEILRLGVPTLGICLGAQMIATELMAKVRPGGQREFGMHELRRDHIRSSLLNGVPHRSPVLLSHGDQIVPNRHMQIFGTTDHSPAAAFSHRHLWGVQFHPECTETTYGAQIFKNFCFKICSAKDRFPTAAVANQKVAELAKLIGRRKVLLGLSGGSDSSVVAYLLRHAMSASARKLRGVYIRGTDRPDDEKHVLRYFQGRSWINVQVVDATESFLEALRGKLTMRDKRIAIRSVYKDVLEKEAAKFGANFIAQGTLYTDLSESGHGYASGARKAQIKLHHNINLQFSLPELTPLADMVKDSARSIGRKIGVPRALLIRHPFPGPGLVVRIEGEVTPERLALARKLDDIYIGELRKWKLYETVWQAGAVVMQSITTCTKGDDATQGSVVMLWAVWSVNGFTAQAADLPRDFRRHVARRITNECREVGAVVYRESDKPPSTIEIG